MMLITGTTGNVGKHLVEKLLDEGAQVRVLVRDESKVAYLGNKVARAVGDLDDTATLTTAMQRVGWTLIQETD